MVFNLGLQGESISLYLEEKKHRKNRKSSVSFRPSSLCFLFLFFFSEAQQVNLVGKL